MLFLRSWLEDYLDLSRFSNEALVKLITQRSSEVEEAIEIDDYFGGKVLVGRIENSYKHPQADRLKIFDVNLGERGKIKIVSAAPNVQDGLIVPVAVEGCRLPFLTITPRKMRGETSEGMCLGKSELMLETEPSSGLWELNEVLAGRKYYEKGVDSEWEVAPFLGKSLCEILPEYFPRETLIDIKVLPDKIGTIGNHLGMALELATCLGDFQLLKPAAKRFLDPGHDIVGNLDSLVRGESTIKIEFEDKTNYTNNFWLFDLKLQKSNEDPNYYLPHELTKRMFLTERHLVGGLADLSNYLLSDMGQPTHFFSQEKTLVENHGSWFIKELTFSQQFQGLGQLKDAQIPVGINVIEDQSGRVLAIPAISGSEGTKTDFHEKEIIFEVANFDPEEVAKNSFLLKYRSEGAKIWAGKVRATQMLACVLRAIEILQAQSEVSFKLESILHWSKKFGNQGLTAAAESILDSANVQTIEVDIDFIARRLDDRGLSFWRDQIEEKLSLLGSYDSRSHNLKPYIYFTELNDNYDIFLEVARLIGFDKFQEHSIEASIQNDRTAQFQAFEKIRLLIREYGFEEVITRPFVTPEQVFDSASSLEVIKAYRSQEPFLRDRLIYSLANCLADNLKRGEKDPKIFELNRVYFQQSALVEKIYLAGVTTDVDPYALTSLGRDVLAKANLEGWQIEPLDEPLSQVGQGYFYNSGTLDYRIVQLSNAFKKTVSLPINKSLYYFEFDLTKWDYKLREHPLYSDESIYPAVTRAYSLFVPKSIYWQKIVNAIGSSGADNFQVQAKPVERLSHDDKQDILNFQLRFVSHDRTLTGEEIAAWEVGLMQGLAELGEVVLR